ncbi:hypothetical protein JX265_013683 [Neoarthrinium moseri]|uniref:Cytochrome P450 n=1 Tax=Neoarthrinium moseri TaxID=1658444 RepID=A0A9P9W8J0_9PEZI|nr:hypothetical protein JX265_013683 [Neoarthrinium moseri]
MDNNINSITYMAAAARNYFLGQFNSAQVHRPSQVHEPGNVNHCQDIMSNYDWTLWQSRRTLTNLIRHIFHDVHKSLEARHEAIARMELLSLAGRSYEPASPPSKKLASKHLSQCCIVCSECATRRYAFCRAGDHAISFGLQEMIRNNEQQRRLKGSFPFLTRYPELTLDKWARRFGDLYSVWLGGQLFMINSSPEVAKDLMVTHGSVFSSRKEMFIKGQTILKGRGVTATPYNDTWKKHRRLVTNWRRADETAKYVLAIERESIDMIQCLYEASGNGAKFVNPQPFTGRCSLNTHRDIVATYGGMIKEMDERIQKGQDMRDCLAKSMLEARKQEDLDELDVIFLATSFMVGGVETTAAVMQWFCSLIPSYPEIQRRAQSELASHIRSCPSGSRRHAPPISTIFVATYEKIGIRSR